MLKLYHLQNGLLLESRAGFHHLPGADWDHFVNDDSLYDKAQRLAAEIPAVPLADEWLQKRYVPAKSQEIWAAGVTYYRSKVGRQEESKTAGSSDFYARVYEAERPELFFKSLPHRAAAHGEAVHIRKDSVWDVPEPELTLMITSSGKIVGYTIGNDMSSRSIEGENPLYLPQAKIYDRSAALGPCLFIAAQPLAPDTEIALRIERAGQAVFEATVAIRQIKRSFEELASWLFRECSFPHGVLLMTGTGIVPGSDFTLQSGDQIHIAIDPIGTLSNWVA
jgi:2-dehydro-3-deoxy-D-arabinonate dehydratase